MEPDFGRTIFLILLGQSIWFAPVTPVMRHSLLGLARVRDVHSSWLATGSPWDVAPQAARVLSRMLAERGLVEVLVEICSPFLPKNHPTTLGLYWILLSQRNVILAVWAC